jgi:CBS domain-containing protein
VRVEEVMTKNPTCCGPDTPLRDVARLMVDCDCGEIPVLDSRSGRPIGVITDRDIVCRTIAEGRNPLELAARDCMTSRVVTVTSDKSIDECCELMERHQIRRILVVDAAGPCCGIVSQADIARRLPPRSAS